jgi:hypothetical protein
VRPRELLQTARREVAELTGRRVETVSGLRRDGDESWIVTVEVLELERVPSTADVLAEYEVRLDPDGRLLSYRRGDRYARGSTRSE